MVHQLVMIHQLYQSKSGNIFMIWVLNPVQLRIPRFAALRDEEWSAAPSVGRWDPSEGDEPSRQHVRTGLRVSAWSAQVRVPVKFFSEFGLLQVTTFNHKIFVVFVFSRRMKCRSPDFPGPISLRPSQFLPKPSWPHRFIRNKNSCYIWFISCVVLPDLTILHPGVKIRR